MTNIHPSLESLTINLSDLLPDPRNARKHSPRNLAAIAESLRVHGQRKPIVVQRNEDGALIIRAGNGTCEAAQSLGWDRIAAVVVEETDEEAIAFAIRDNRSGELAEWDLEALTEGLTMLDGVGVELESLGFESYEYEPLLNVEDWSPFESEKADDGTKLAERRNALKFSHDQWSTLGELLGCNPSAEAVLEQLATAKAAS